LKPQENRTRFSSQTFKAKYQYNAIAPHWKESGASDDNRTVSVRTSLNGLEWSEWAKVEAMRPQKDGAPHSDEVFPEAPIITLGNYFQYRVDLSRPGSTTPAVRDMTITYIDSRPTTAQKISSALYSFFAPSVTASGTVPRIISRADWGSPDPTGNAFHGTDQYWTPQYHPVGQVFIHHTVDSNYKSQTDGASLVRAVWQYHTYTLGWGDIGYNYLVDESGNVYQGRAHGDNIDGGHVYGYNSGSMGVALLGCFQPNDSTCAQLNNYSTAGPSSPMLTGLTDLLAYKLTSYEIDPEAQHTFCKGDGSACLNLNTISGHRDAYPTSCPGDLAYADLQYVRDTTAAKKEQGFRYSAKQTTFPETSLGDKTESTITLSYKNTGTATWFSPISGQPNPVVLGTGNVTDHVSVFQGTGWPSNTRAAFLNELSVVPGAIGTFTFNIKNPLGYYGKYYEYFRPLAEGLTDFSSFTGVPILTRSLSYDITSQEAYTNSSKATPLNMDSLSPGQSGWLVLKIKNTGNTTWNRDGINPIHLGTDVTQDNASPFCAVGWLGCNRPAKLIEATVTPGQTGTFEWPITVPNISGVYREYVTPVMEGVGWLNSTGLNFYMNINHGYTWSSAGQYAYSDSTKTTSVDLLSLSPGQKVYVGLLARNTGDTIWYRDGLYPVHLGTTHNIDRSSSFCDTTWQSCNRPAQLVNASDTTKTSVSPGEMADFGFWYVAPGPGTYYEYFNPVVENITWMNDPGVNHYTHVNGGYNWEVAGQYAYTDNTKKIGADLTNLSRGQRVYVGILAKNTGDTVWYQNGRYPVNLGTSSPLDRSSRFCESTWLGCNRPVAMKNSVDYSKISVRPGEIAEFGYWYTAPQEIGTYFEGFTPVAENLGWLKDIGVNHYSVVK